MTSKGPFQPQAFCDSMILSFDKEFSSIAAFYEEPSFDCFKLVICLFHLSTPNFYTGEDRIVDLSSPSPGHL